MPVWIPGVDRYNPGLPSRLRTSFKILKFDILIFEIRKIAVCFLWLLLPGDYRVTDEALLAETT